MSQLGMGNSQIRFTETFNVFRLLKGFTDKRRFQHFKTLVFRSLLLSNMQMSYPR